MDRHVIRSELLQHSHVEISQIQLLFVKDIQCLPDCRKRTLMAIAKVINWIFSMLGISFGTAEKFRNIC